MEDSNPDLETFRQQWRAEVEGRNKVDSKKSKLTQNKQHARKQAFDDLPSQKGSRHGILEEQLVPQGARRRLSSNRKVIDHAHEPGEGSKQQFKQEPKSALEHYEKAVEREDQGSLGDSLDLYRKAFKVRNSRCCPMVLTSLLAR